MDGLGFQPLVLRSDNAGSPRTSDSTQLQLAGAVHVSPQHRCGIEVVAGLAGCRVKLICRGARLLLRTACLSGWAHRARPGTVQVITP